MKKIKLILGITIGTLITGIVGVTATTLISSSQVIYKDDITVEASLNNLYDELLIGKEKIAQTLTNKGVETTTNNTLTEMASNIDKIQSEFNFSEKYEFTTIAGSVGTRSLNIESKTGHLYIVFIRTGFISDSSQITFTNCELIGFNSISTGSNFYDDLFIIKANSDNNFTLTINSENGYFNSIRYTDLISGV